MTHIPATYIGIQPGYGRHPSLLLYNLLMDIPGHPMGSTVSLQTLMREGFHPVEKGGGGSMTQYIIESNECDELSGEALCWNNEDGWVDRASATLFEIDEMNANAYLIAAAPAMYEALKSALNNLDRLADERSHYRTMWLDHARAVLAQAEGK